MNEGWVCPRCGKINAPDVKECICRPDYKKYEPVDEYDPYYSYTTDNTPWHDWYIIC